MLSPGTQVGSYTIVEFIASGGMAMVYKAQHTRFGDVVAVKVMLPHLAQKPKARHRFEQEGFVQRQLEHPNIVQVFDVVEVGDSLAMIMEFVEGCTLAEWLELNQGPKTPSEIAPVMVPVLEAMAYAHKREVVHRDLKPANVMMKRLPDGGFQPKVTDFGLVKVLSDTGGDLTRTGTMMGTMPYMAPEQASGAKTIDARADVFALGVMLWQMSFGRLPVDSKNLLAVGDFYAGRSDLKQPLGDLGDLLRQAMHTDFKCRTETAGHLARSFRALQSSGERRGEERQEQKEPLPSPQSQTRRWPGLRFRSARRVSKSTAHRIRLQEQVDPVESSSHTELSLYTLTLSLTSLFWIVFLASPLEGKFTSPLEVEFDEPMAELLLTLISLLVPMLHMGFVYLFLFPKFYTFSPSIDGDVSEYKPAKFGHWLLVASVPFVLPFAWVNRGFETYRGEELHLGFFAWVLLPVFTLFSFLVIHHFLLKPGLERKHWSARLNFACLIGILFAAYTMLGPVQ